MVEGGEMGEQAQCRGISAPPSLHTPPRHPAFLPQGVGRVLRAGCCPIHSQDSGASTPPCSTRPHWSVTHPREEAGGVCLVWARAVLSWIVDCITSQAPHSEQHQHVQGISEHLHRRDQHPVQQAVCALQVISVPAAAH